MNSIRKRTKSLLSVIKPKIQFYVEFILGWILIIQGVIELQSESQLPSHALELLSPHWAEVIVASWQLVAGALLIAGVLCWEKNVSRPMRRVGSFMAFFAFTFLSFLGIFSEGVNDLFWIATIGLSLMSAIMYIRAGEVGNE